MPSGEQATCLVSFRVLQVFNEITVARQAQAILERDNPMALRLAELMLSPLKVDFPNLTTDENNHPFTECALFADNIKGMGYSFQSPWHFKDIPWY